jgi:hypothetical protein
MARRLNVSLSRQTLVTLRAELYAQCYNCAPSTTVYKRSRQLADLHAVDEALAGGALGVAVAADEKRRAAERAAMPRARTITHG